MICSYSVTPFSRLTTLLYRTFPRTTVAYVKCAAGNGTGAALVAGGCDGAGRMWPGASAPGCRGAGTPLLDVSGRGWAPAAGGGGGRPGVPGGWGWLEAGGDGGDVVVGAPVPLGGVGAGDDVRGAGRVGDPPADVVLLPVREAVDGVLGGGPF